MTVITSRLPWLLPALLLVVVAAGLLAPVEMQPAEAAFLGANGQIAFSSSSNTGFKIFAVNPDGKGLAELNLGTANNEQPAWSADGNWIAYSSGGEIYMHTDGHCDQGLCVFGTTRRLTTNTARDLDPTFSPDGSKIAFHSERDGNFEIYVMDTADNDNDNNADIQTRLTNDAAFDSDPSWSPDGAKIAFESDRGINHAIYVMNANGTNPVFVGNTTGDDFDPNWSPDGTRIVFTNWVDGKTPQVWIMNADGSAPKRLTKGAAANENPAWSPDGSRIAFQTNRGGGDTEIYVMKARPEGKRNRPRNLTRNNVFDFKPDWQPVE
jgi:Tol biopolymer transport system component